MIWRANQGNSTHDYYPTHYLTERYGRGMYSCQRRDKRRYSDNEPTDTNTDTEDNLHVNLSHFWIDINDAAFNIRAP
jgi:hypothetical protein